MVKKPLRLSNTHKTHIDIGACQRDFEVGNSVLSLKRLNGGSFVISFANKRHESCFLSEDQYTNKVRDIFGWDGIPLVNKLVEILEEIGGHPGQFARAIRDEIDSVAEENKNGLAVKL